MPFVLVKATIDWQQIFQPPHAMKGLDKNYLAMLSNSYFGFVIGNLH